MRWSKNSKMAVDSIFSKIIRKEIPADIIYQDEWVVAFRDIQPQAPVHILVVPRQQVTDILEASPELLQHLFVGVKNVAKLVGLEVSGFRTVINTGREAGQTVFHLHVHILAGRSLSWPPG